MARRQVTAGGILGQEFLLRRRLGGKSLAHQSLGGERCGQAQSYGYANDGGMPGQQRMNHDISIYKLDIGGLKRRSGNRAPDVFSRRENDRFAACPQGHKPGNRPAFPAPCRPLGPNGGEIAAAEFRQKPRHLTHIFG
jgi:hypothetical protein